VIWHKDVAEDKEAVAKAQGFEGLLEDCAGVVVVEVRVLMVTGESDEVLVAGGLVSLEAAGHGFDGSTGWWKGSASGVPHSCPKCEGMNGPPGVL
jgi:hypothetical protein